MSLAENSDIIESFASLGVSTNEAKVYLALLENHPITGYQLSKVSGILRPVVYEMLGRLVEKGGARIVKSNPDTYIPVDIEQFLRNIETDFTQARANISALLNKYLVVDESDYFWNITGIKNILNTVIAIVEQAQTEIYLSLNRQEYFDPLTEILHQKLNQGVKIDAFSYYDLNTHQITLYSYKLNPASRYENIPLDQLTIAIDKQQGLIANFTDIKTSKAVHSKNEAQVHLIRENIIHNIYLIRLWKFLGTDKLKVLMTNEDRKLLEFIDKHLTDKMP